MKILRYTYMKKTIKDTGIPSRNFDKEIIHFFIKV